MKEKKKRKIKFGYIISAIVILVIVGLAIYLTLPMSGVSKYGDRLEGIEDVSFKKKDKEKITNSLKDNEKVTTATLKIEGRIIYITFNVDKDTSKDDARKIAEGSLENISEEVKNFYDINYTITKTKEEGTKTNEDGETEEIIKKEFPIMGYKNIKSSKIVW